MWSEKTGTIKARWPIRQNEYLNMRFIFIAPVIHEEFYLPLKKGMNDAAAMMNVEVAFTGT